MLTTATPSSVPATPKYDATTAADSEARAPAMTAVALMRLGGLGRSSECVSDMSSAALSRVLGGPRHHPARIVGLEPTAIATARLPGLPEVARIGIMVWQRSP